MGPAPTSTTQARITEQAAGSPPVRKGYPDRNRRFFETGSQRDPMMITASGPAAMFVLSAYSNMHYRCDIGNPFGPEPSGFLAGEPDG